MDCSFPGSSMGFSREVHWSELLYLPPVDLVNPEFGPASPVDPALHTGS